MSERPVVLSRGVWGVIATPFIDPNLELDRESLSLEVAHYREIGAAGVVALGVFGEAERLSSDEQVAVIDTVLEEAGEMRVVVGLSAVATRPAAEQARVLASRGEGVVGTMALVNSDRPDQLTAHYETIAETTGLGVIIQDYPLQSGVHIANSLLAETVNMCDCAVAVKSEVPPTAMAIADLVELVNIPVFGGLGAMGLLDELLAGSAGVMTGFSHPEGLLTTVAAFDDAGFEAAWEVWQRWLPLANFEGQPGIGLAIRKEILHRRGYIKEARVRPPGKELPLALHRMIELHMQQLHDEVV